MGCGLDLGSHSVLSPRLPDLRQQPWTPPSDPGREEHIAPEEGSLSSALAGGRSVPTPQVLCKGNLIPSLL